MISANPLESKIAYEQSANLANTAVHPNFADVSTLNTSSRTSKLPALDLKYSDLIASKERELRDMQILQITNLEKAVKDRDLHIHELTQKMNTLKKDFKYNLDLFDERDAELDRNESEIRELRVKVFDYETELRTLKCEMDELRERLSKGNIHQLEEINFLREKCKDLKAVNEGLRWTNEDNLRKIRTQAEASKVEHTRQVLQLEEDLEIQRRDMSSMCDDLLRQRDSEVHDQKLKFSEQLEVAQQKVALANKEANRARIEAEKYKAEGVKMSKALAEAQAALRSATWQAEDALQTKNADVASLQTELASMKSKMSENSTFYENRINELLNTLRSIELSYTQLRHREDALIEKFAISETDLKRSKSNEEEIARILNNTQVETDFRIQNLTKALNEVQQKGAELQVAITSKDGELGKFKENVELLKQKMVTEQNRSEKLTEELNEMRNSNENMKQAFAKQLKLVEDLNGKIFNLEIEKQELEEKYIENQKQIGELHMHVQEKEKKFSIELSSYILGVRKQAEHISKLSEKNSELTAKISQLSKQTVNISKSSPVFSDDMGPAFSMHSEPSQNKIGSEVKIEEYDWAAENQGMESANRDRPEKTNESDWINESQNLKLTNRNVQNSNVTSNKTGENRCIDSANENMRNSAQESDWAAVTDNKDLNLVNKNLKNPEEESEWLKKYQMLKKENKEMRDVIKAMRVEAEKMQSTDPNDSSVQLKTALEQSQAELDYIRNERDKVIELSNRLQSSLNHETQSNRVKLEEAVLETARKIEAKYDHKLVKLERLILNQSSNLINLDTESDEEHFESNVDLSRDKNKQAYCFKKNKIVIKKEDNDSYPLQASTIPHVEGKQIRESRTVPMTKLKMTDGQKKAAARLRLAAEKKGINYNSFKKIGENE